MTTVIKSLKYELRLRDYTTNGDKWGAAMGAMFDLCELAYERMNLPVEWEFKVGAAGNLIEDDNMFLDFPLSEDFDTANAELLEIGNYLNRLVRILDRAGISY